MLNDFVINYGLYFAINMTTTTSTMTIPRGMMIRLGNAKRVQF